jgi:hypothetical protein
MVYYRAWYHHKDPIKIIKVNFLKNPKNERLIVYQLVPKWTIFGTKKLKYINSRNNQFPLCHKEKKIELIRKEREDKKRKNEKKKNCIRKN